MTYQLTDFKQILTSKNLISNIQNDLFKLGNYHRTNLVENAVNEKRYACYYSSIKNDSNPLEYFHSAGIFVIATTMALYAVPIVCIKEDFLKFSSRKQIGSGISSYSVPLSQFTVEIFDSVLEDSKLKENRKIAFKRASKPINQFISYVARMEKSYSEN